MVSTGLLLLEVNLWFKDEVSIISMADRTLGTVGKIIGWAGFLFLFYGLMVAYISGTGELLDKEETVQIVPIELGRDWGKTIEITAGIKENDRIITNPGSKIRSGMRAKVHTHENEDEDESK
jgi:multidrug efflux pump subunit AcrA (membrane-fusion protein)